MTRIPDTRFRDLFLRPTPWIDVRAPVEYGEGAVPGATNLPLLTDRERHEVGLTYKEKGQAAAVELGHRLVSGRVKDERVEKWREAAAAEEAVVYCFRGGMRSQIVQNWLAERGVKRPIVEGGYKALRRFLLSVFALELPRLQFEVLAGPTGSGKTEYMKASGRPFLDLEGLACHRGSAFGALEEKPQPSQADFENALAVAILRLADQPGPILIENESRMIGRLVVPEPVFDIIKSSPKRILNVSFEQRVENIFKDYVLESSLGREGRSERFADFERAVGAISRKLGGQRTQEIRHDLSVARSEFQTSGRLDDNRVWIRKILQWYYDPTY